MPKNLKGGKKFKQFKKRTSLPKRQFPIIENTDNSDELYYAQISTILGNGRFIVKLIHDNILHDYNAKVRGSMYKKEWLKKNDFVLCSMRPTNDKTKFDIIFKYSHEEIEYLSTFPIFNSFFKLLHPNGVEAPQLHFEEITPPISYTKVEDIELSDNDTDLDIDLI